MKNSTKLTVDCVIQARGGATARRRTGLRAGSVEGGYAVADVVSEKVGPDHTRTGAQYTP